MNATVIESKYLMETLRMEKFFKEHISRATFLEPNNFTLNFVFSASIVLEL